MTDIQKLIAEARMPHCKDCDHFMRAMADALEAEHHRANTAATTGERILADALRYRAAIEQAEDHVTRHYLDLRIGQEVLDILTRVLKENT